MNATIIKEKLISEGYEIDSNNVDSKKIRIDFKNGMIANIFQSTKKVQIQGKGSADAKEELKALIESIIEGKELQQVNNKIFVVYGHDMISRNQLELFLKNTGFEPLILDQLPTGGTTIIEKLEHNINMASFGVVLITPDDVGYRKDHEEEAMGRARQNVVLELGMLLSKLGREKVFILMKEQEKTEKPSDISGLIYMPFKENVNEIGPHFAREVEQFGFNIPASKLI